MRTWPAERSCAPVARPGQVAFEKADKRGRLERAGEDLVGAGMVKYM
jgi:hypothetical protein